MTGLYRLLLAIFLTIAWPFAAVAQESCRTLFESAKVGNRSWKWEQVLGINEAELFDRMPAVHVTRFMPANGLVRAGDAPETFRPEIHFALGEMVRSHQDGYWEGMPYAIVTSLRRLEPQLLNVMMYDTFIFGDFKLNRSDFLIVPIQDAEKAPQGVNVITYDPKQKSIRQTVDELIARLNWLPVRGRNGMGRIHHLATLYDHNVNVPSFFAPILSRNPHVSFGGHGKSQIGMAAAFGHLDLKWLPRQNFGEATRNYSVATENLVLDLDLAKIALRKVDKIASHYSPHLRKAFDKQRERLILYMNLAAADIKLRKTHGRSIRYAAPGYNKNTLLANATSMEKLEHYLQSIVDKIPEVKEEKSLVSDWTIEDLTFLSPVEFEAVVAKHHQIFSYPVTDFVRLAYGIEKFLIIGYERAREEGLFPIIESAAQSAVKQDIPYFFKEIWKTYFMGEHFGPDSSRLKDILKLFNHPSMREFLAVKMEMFLPPKSEFTLEDILIAHPKTRDAYKPYPSSFTDPRVVRFLRAVPLGGWRGIDYTPVVNDWHHPSLSRLRGHEGPVHPPFADFAIAAVAATARRSMGDPFKYERYLHEIPAHVAAIALSREFSSIDDSILTALRHQPAKLIEMWAKLGLEAQFRRRFPTDEDFWQCQTPLFQIYLELLEAPVSKG